MARIPTKDSNGKPNGWLLPLWNATEHPELRPEQVYLTAIAVGCSKGPHLHMRREQRYYCIRGAVSVTTRLQDGSYRSVALRHGVSLVIPAGTPSMLTNLGAEEAWVVNMPSPAWTKDDPDDHVVTGWKL